MLWNLHWKCEPRSWQELVAFLDKNLEDLVTIRNYNTLTLIVMRTFFSELYTFCSQRVSESVKIYQTIVSYMLVMYLGS